MDELICEGQQLVHLLLGPCCFVSRSARGPSCTCALVPASNAKTTLLFLLHHHELAIASRMSLFPSLSTRALPEPLLLHAPSCNPRMDVALLSNPTTSGTDASLHLYRLSGGSTSAAAHASGSITGGTAVNPAGRVWESTIEGSATPAPTSNALNAKSSAKGKGRQSNAQGALYQDWIPPRLAETVAWSPDGM